MNNSDNEMGPFGRSFIGDFPTLGSMLLLLSTFFLSALFSFGNLIPFIILLILSSSLVIFICYKFIEPHFNVKSKNNLNTSVRKINFSLNSGSNRPKNPMSFKQAIKNFFKKWADFKSRSSRSEYNWFILFSIILNIVVEIIFTITFVIIYLGDPDSVFTLITIAILLILTLIICILLLLLIIPSITLTIRRLHDLGFSGWYLLWYLLISTSSLIISYVVNYYLFILVYVLILIPSLLIMILPGENSHNKYGPIPNNQSDRESFSINL